MTVLAGFAPIAIGTETDGSLVVPADQAALYTLKATVGSTQTEETLPYTLFTDSLGPLAKQLKDIAALLSIVMNGKKSSSCLPSTWKIPSVGFVDQATWQSNPAAVKPKGSFDKQVLSWSAVP